MNLPRLHTEAGRALLEHAQLLLRESDPRQAAVRLRRHTDDPELASQALTQASLRRDAASKFGVDAAAMFFTRDGLEQASRAVVARRRAQRLAQAGAAHVADLCCGIASDALALARSGLQITAYDVDSEAVAAARANAAALGLDRQIEVRQADVRDVDLSDCDTMFADPARRANGRRIFDPSRYSPPLDQLWRVSQGMLRRVCKVGPGIDHGAIPADCEAEWVSVDGAVVEAALWRGDVATVPRRASVLHGDATHELTGDGEQRADVGEVGEYLYEPDGAVIRAHLVAELAQDLDARLAHPDIAYLYSDAAQATPFAAGYRVREVLPFHVKRLRALLKQRGVGRLTIKKRGADVDPDRLRRELKPSGDAEATLIVTRVGERHTALLCDPL